MRCSSCTIAAREKQSEQQNSANCQAAPAPNSECLASSQSASAAKHSDYLNVFVQGYTCSEAAAATCSRLVEKRALVASRGFPSAVSLLVAPLVVHHTRSSASARSNDCHCSRTAACSLERATERWTFSQRCASGSPHPISWTARLTCPAQKNAAYGTQEYWDERYAREAPEAEFDWLKTYAEMKPFIHRHVPDKTSRVLHLGCGNSTLPKDMYDDGYEEQTALDYSAIVVERMKALHESREKLSCT